MQNNRDNILNKKNKLNDGNKNIKKSNEIAAQKSNANNQSKNDTYESVCPPPDDSAERLKMAQRHSIGVTGNNTVSSTTPNGILNGSMPSNGNCNNNRLLKRVISAPAASNETKGN